MRITHASISGFRRFAEATTVRLDGSLISVLGPNEAGKTSFLQALEALDRDEPLSPDDPTRDVIGADPWISATFELEEGDIQAISHVREGGNVRRATLVKRAEGHFDVKLEPRPSQDFEPRRWLAALGDDLPPNALLDRASRNNKLSYQPSLLRRLTKWAESDEDPLPSAFVKEINEAASALRQAAKDAKEGESADQDQIERLIEELTSLRAHEQEYPVKVCGDLLLERRPRFLAFSEPERDLKPQYDLDDIADNPPQPLRNLAALSGLDIDLLIDRIDNNRLPQAHRQCEVASEKLAEVFAESWVRADVSPVLKPDGRDLHIFVRTPGGEDLSRFDERSDGFRWFIALVAFVSGQPERPSDPVLLIDEAETHLSYDAQANLSSTLAEQDVAQLVIYTTHSAGCLPPDLGTGIRAVVPAETGERSSITNGFWHDGPGYTPLMVAMGANALAFTPARRVVVGEGASECILLPTLLREATGRSHLSFQVAPGLANVSETVMHDIVSMAGEVAYLVDGDEGGNILKQNLISWGFPEQRIVSYRDVGRLHVSLEDLIHPRTLAMAVNLELRRWQGEGPSVLSGELPDTARMQFLNEWCQRNGLDPVNKPALAQRIVDLRGDEILVARKHRTRLGRLVDRLESVLSEIPSN